MYVATKREREREREREPGESGMCVCVCVCVRYTDQFMLHMHKQIRTQRITKGYKSIGANNTQRRHKVELKHEVLHLIIVQFFLFTLII